MHRTFLLTKKRSSEHTVCRWLFERERSRHNRVLLRISEHTPTLRVEDERTHCVFHYLYAGT